VAAASPSGGQPSVERRSLIPVMVRLAGTTEGVVRVQDWRTFDLDDARLQPSASNLQRS
jgi:hypothetical protein